MGRTLSKRESINPSFWWQSVVLRFESLTHRERLKVNRKSLRSSSHSHQYLLFFNISYQPFLNFLIFLQKVWDFVRKFRRMLDFSWWDFPLLWWVSSFSLMKSDVWFGFYVYEKFCSLTHCQGPSRWLGQSLPFVCNCTLPFVGSLTLIRFYSCVVPFCKSSFWFIYLSSLLESIKAIEFLGIIVWGWIFLFGWWIAPVFCTLEMFKKSLYYIFVHMNTNLWFSLFVLKSLCICSSSCIRKIMYSLLFSSLPAFSLNKVVKMVAERFTVDLDKPLVFQVMHSIITSFRHSLFLSNKID